MDNSNTTSLSDYEQTRAHNIERNNAKLRSLGLISALEEARSNAFAWGRRHVENMNDEADVVIREDLDSEDEWTEEGEKRDPKKRKRDTTTPTSPSRQSRRLQGLQPTPSAGTTTWLERIILPTEERQKSVEECREARQRAALEVAKAGHAMAGKENPTATYEHCLMRIRTLTEKKLLARVKSIERAVGKHCVVKMAIFKSCLQDEGMWEIAEKASEALERLKGMQGPPNED